MTNQELWQIFREYGEVVSAKIMTERDTGRGKGYGFVSFDNPHAAANAIHHLNGFQVSFAGGTIA